MVVTDRPGQLEHELLKLADFAALNPCKAASRIELLLSESKNIELSPLELTADDFEVHQHHHHYHHNHHHRQQHRTYHSILFLRSTIISIFLLFPLYI